MKKLWKGVLAFLKIETFAKDENGKLTITSEQQERMVKYFGKDFTDKFVADLAKEEGEDASGDPPSGDDPEISAQILELQSRLQMREEQIVGLQSTITILAEEPEPDPIIPKPIGKGAAAGATADWLKSGKYLFGVTQPHMAITPDRHWNVRAWVQATRKANPGAVLLIPDVESSVDYTTLKSDLGAYYRTRRQDAIVSLVQTLPSVEKYFPLLSGYQDQSPLVARFMGEFSQPYQSGFTPKGSFDFQPEILTMFNVKFDHLFTDLKELENNWLGYLNKEGSDAIKLSFVEYLLFEAAKVLHNERELRRVKGVKVAAINGVATSFIHAADGLLKFIDKKIAAFQIKPFSIDDWTDSTIVAHIKTGTSMIPADLIATGKMRCYISESTYRKHNENYRSLFGLVNNSMEGINHPLDYPNVPFVVLEGTTFRRIIWTFDGNFNTFELLPGEMYKFNLEQVDRTLKVWSDWKESIWALVVGKKFASSAEQTYDHQIVFTTEVEDTDYAYVTMVKDDTSPSVLSHTSLVSQENSGPRTITTIDDATVGVPIRIKCGSSSNKISIAKTGDFSLITAAWNPGQGDEIIMMKRSDGKFVELKRTDSTSNIKVFSANDVTPSVADSNVFFTNANTQATTITTLDDAIVGKTYTIYGAGTTSQGQGATGYASYIAASGNFVLTAAMDLIATKWIKLRKSATDGLFYEISRG